MIPVETSLRSTRWRRADGSTVRQYHDTGAWSEPVDEREALYRAAPGRRPPADHLRHALRQLVRAPRDVRELALMCGVEVSTAWSYATQVAERFVGAADLALPLVYPPLVEALRATEDRDGTLTELLRRVEATAILRGDRDWRCLHDRFAHLRLARVCLQVKEL